MTRIKAARVVLTAGLMCGMAGYLQAQETPGQNQPGQAQQGGVVRRSAGTFDSAQFREQRLNQIKKNLAAKDDEWTVLQPAIEKVMTLSSEAANGPGGA